MSLSDEEDAAQAATRSEYSTRPSTRPQRTKAAQPQPPQPSRQQKPAQPQPPPQLRAEPPQAPTQSESISSELHGASARAAGVDDDDEGGDNLVAQVMHLTRAVEELQRVQRQQQQPPPQIQPSPQAQQQPLPPVLADSMVIAEAIATANERLVAALLAGQAQNRQQVISEKIVTELRRLFTTAFGSFKPNAIDRINTKFSDVLAWQTAVLDVAGFLALTAGEKRTQLKTAFASATISADGASLFDSLPDTQFVVVDNVLPALVTFLQSTGLPVAEWSKVPAPTSTSLAAYVHMLLMFQHFAGGPSMINVGQVLAQHLEHPSASSEDGLALRKLNSMAQLKEFLAKYPSSGTVRSQRHQQPSAQTKKKRGTKEAPTAPSAVESETPKSPYVVASLFSHVKSLCYIDVSLAISGIAARAAIDTQANVDVISADLARRAQLRTRACSVQVAGFANNVNAEARATTDVKLVHAGVTLDVTDALVMEDLRFDIILGLPSIARFGIVPLAASDGSFQFEFRRAAAKVVAALTSDAPASTTGFDFDSPVDEMMANIDFEDIAASASFVAEVRAQLTRLHERGLLLGKRSPGAQYPQALHGATHTIEVRAGADLSKAFTPWRHLPFERYRVLKEHFDGLKAAGYVVAATGPSPVQLLPLVVPKHDAKGNISGWRVVIDARRLNAETVQMRHELPRIAELLRFASRGVLTSKVDLKDFFMEFPVAAESQPLLRTRISDTEAVDWTRMVPGDQSAPATAQAFVDRVFRSDDRLGYIDDIIGRHLARDERELLRWLTELIDKCLEHNVTVNAAKSVLFARSNVILGHRVSFDRIEPIRERMQVLIDMRAPTGKQELQRFIAMARWYHSHIANLSLLSAPLTDLLSTRVAWRWTGEHQRAFDGIKQALLHYATLSAPLPDVPIVVSTDASGAAVGFVVEQRDSHGNPRIIALGGRKCNASERNYTVHEKELLALKHVLNVHGEWLLALSGGRPVTWRTDSQTAASFRTMSLDGKSLAMQKFATDMQDFPLTVELVSSVDNPVADAVSRHRQFLSESDEAAVAVLDGGVTNDSSPSSPTSPTSSDALHADATSSETVATPSLSSPTSADQVVAESKSTPVTRVTGDAASLTSSSVAVADVPPDAAASPATVTPIEHFISVNAPSVDIDENLAQFVAAQQADRSLDVYRQAAQGKFVPAEVHALQPCVNENGVLMVRTSSDRSQATPIVPEALRGEFSLAAHYGHDGAHAGERSSLWQSEQIGWWPTQKVDVKNAVQKCLHCQSMRKVPVNSSMGRPSTALRRFEKCHLDHMPMPRSSEGYTGAYVATDAATGFVFVYPTRSKDSDSAIEALRSYIALLDTPRVVQVDSGSELVSEKMQQLAKTEGFELHSGSPYNHQSNGIAESAVHRVKKALVHGKHAARDNDVSLWPKHLVGAVRSVNRAKSSSRGTSAHELMFGAKANLAVARRHGLDVNAGVEHTVPTTGDGQAAFAEQLATHVDELVTQAGERRGRVQESNARQQAKRGQPRDIDVGDFVFVENTGDTQDHAIENKQRQSGPYRVQSIDNVNRRAVLAFMNDEGEYVVAGKGKPVSMNRLQRVDADAVTTPRSAMGEPGAPTWTGANDSQLLLPKEQTAVDKQRVRHVRLAAEQSAPAPKQVVRDAPSRKQARVAAWRQRRQSQLDRETIDIPDGSIPLQETIHFVGGTLLTLATDANDPTNSAKWIVINRRHPRFNEFDQLRRQQRQLRLQKSKSVRRSTRA